MSDDFRLVQSPDWATDTMVNEVLWPLVEQIAREQAEQPTENDDVRPQLG